MSDVPSPAKRAVQAEPAQRNGISNLPWEGALFAAMSALEAQLDACRKENAELLSANALLTARLYKGRVWAQTQTDNWKLRQQAWHRERAELLARLGDHP